MNTENLFCAGTYQKILALVAKPALEEATIKLSTKISKINTTDAADGKVVVTTDKGEAFKFDEIVVTAPLGWLKQNQEAFTPSLPPRFSSAIESIGYGCLEKVYMHTHDILANKELSSSDNILNIHRFISASLAHSGFLQEDNKRQMTQWTRTNRSQMLNSLVSPNSLLQTILPSTQNDGSKKCSNSALSPAPLPTLLFSTIFSATNLALSLPI